MRALPLPDRGDFSIPERGLGYEVWFAQEPLSGYDLGRTLHIVGAVWYNLSHF